MIGLVLFVLTIPNTRCLSLVDPKISVRGGCGWWRGKFEVLLEPNCRAISSNFKDPKHGSSISPGYGDKQRGGEVTRGGKFKVE